MRTRDALFVVALVAASLSWLIIPAAAHHSEAPFYDQDKSVTVRGTVTEWLFRNPHPFLHIVVTEDNGAKVPYVVEFIGAVRLAKMGWTAKTFVPGEVVTVTGHPSRAPGTHGISSAQVARADGTVIPGSGRGGP